MIRRQHNIAGLSLEMIEGGEGPTVLVLHGFRPLPPDAPFLMELARTYHVLAPSLPGFGGSARPDWCATTYDLVHLIRAILAEQPRPVSLIGLSFGGWLAAEIAAAGCDALDRLVLVDTLGIKTGGPRSADILDIFSTNPELVHRATWHDPDAAPWLDRMDDADLQALARDRAALCQYGWHPFLHNPSLRRCLHRIAVPTLLLWGESDRIVTPAYGAAFQAEIAGAGLEIIPGAGHCPDLEQPHVTAERILRFLAGR